MTAATASTGRDRTTWGGDRLGETKIPKALLEADIATLRAALEQRQKSEVQSILAKIRELDAQRTELNAQLIGLGYRANGSAPARPRPPVGTRGKRSELADGSVETIITEALGESPNERPGFYYDRIISAGGNRAQARRILGALVSTQKVKAEGNRPHTRYSLA